MGAFNNSVELYVFRRARTSRDGLTSAGAPCDCAYDSRTDLWPANPSPSRCMPVPIPTLRGPVGATYPGAHFRATLDEPANRMSLYLASTTNMLNGALPKFGVNIEAGLPFVEDFIAKVLTTLPTPDTGGLLYTWQSTRLFSSITLTTRTDVALVGTPVGVNLVVYLDRVCASGFSEEFGPNSVKDP